MQIGFLLEYGKMPDAPPVIPPLTDDVLIGAAARAALLVVHWKGFKMKLIGIDGRDLVNFKFWQVEHFIDILGLHLSIPLLFVRTYNITGMADVFPLLASIYFVKH